MKKQPRDPKTIEILDDIIVAYHEGQHPIIDSDEKVFAILSARDALKGETIAANDYIAEYVKEKHYNLLGFKFIGWKMGYMMGRLCKGIIGE